MCVRVCVHVAGVGGVVFLPLLPVVHTIKGRQSTGSGRIGQSCGNYLCSLKLTSGFVPPSGYTVLPPVRRVCVCVCVCV